MLLPLSNAQRIARFGSFKFVSAPVPGNPERIKILNGWDEKNIADVSCPQLRRVVNVHHMAAGPFLALWLAWEKAGLLDRVHAFNGAWAPRYKRGRAGTGVAGLSNHAWGTAFDINAREYPLGKIVAPGAPIRALVPIAEGLGWFWGGNFRSRPDGMHFEFCG
jgi:hypothetical protein